MLDTVVPAFNAKFTACGRHGHHHHHYCYHHCLMSHLHLTDFFLLSKVFTLGIIVSFPSQKQTTALLNPIESNSSRLQYYVWEREIK